MSDDVRRIPWLPVNEPSAEADAPVGEPQAVATPEYVQQATAEAAVEPQSVHQPTAKGPFGSDFLQQPTAKEGVGGAEVDVRPRPFTASPYLAPAGATPQVTLPPEEILPTVGSAVFPGVAAAGSATAESLATQSAAADAPTPELAWDSVRQLGEAAVMAAAGGVAGHALAADAPLPDFGAAPAFVPRFEPPAAPAGDHSRATVEAQQAPTLPSPASAAEQGRTAGRRRSGLAAPTTVEPLPQPTSPQPTPTQPTPTRHSAWDASSHSVFPRVDVPVSRDAPTEILVTDISEIDSSTSGRLTPAGPAPHGIAALLRRPVTWIVVGVLAAAGLAWGAYRLFFMPEPIILPAPVSVAPAATPTIQPVTVTDSTPLIDAMPTTVWMYALTSATPIEVLGDTTLTARTAEHARLTYGATQGAQTFTVDVLQHYSAEDAQTAFTALSAGGTNGADVLAGTEVVGRSALLAGTTTDTVVWRNGTLVCVLTGPAGQVEDFFAYFGM